MPWIDFTAGAGGQWSMAFLRNLFSVRNLMWVVVTVSCAHRIFYKENLYK